MVELNLNYIVPDRTRRFAVVVCPKCRKHAQVIEQANKTTGCQHCGVLLKIRKLRVFFSSDELSEAVAARTHLQAGLCGKDAAEFFEKLVEEGAAQVPAFTSEKLEQPVLLPVERAKKTERALKKSAGKILSELLEASGGVMDAEKLEAAALERGIGPEKFEKALKKLQAEGDIYSPSKGVIKIV